MSALEAAECLIIIVFNVVSSEAAFILQLYLWESATSALVSEIDKEDRVDRVVDFLFSTRRNDAFVVWRNAGRSAVKTAKHRIVGRIAWS